MPRAAATHALVGVITLIIAIAIAVVPVVDARPKDKNGAKKGNVTEETVPTEETPGQQPAPVAQDLVTDGGGANDRTVLQLDADGDYLPDAFDNCPDVQNPDQADNDGDGTGDACTAQIDSDGDGRPDKGDNCPNVATADQTDTDGDAIGDVCDKSPDGVEPTPEPPVDYNASGGAQSNEVPPPESGAGQDGVAVERPGHSRSMERQRTDRTRPTITTGVDGATEADGSAIEEDAAEIPPADETATGDALIAEADISGTVDPVPEQPEPLAETADEREPVASGDWATVLRIDAGATDDTTPVDTEALDAADGGVAGSDEPQQPDRAQVNDSQFAHGWVRAKLLLQEEEARGTDSGEQDAAKQRRDADDTASASAPVPVENGLVIASDNAAGSGQGSREPTGGAATGDGQPEPPRPDPASDDETTTSNDRADPRAADDGSRRNGSSRGAAADARAQVAAAADSDSTNRRKKRRDQKGADAAAGRWSQDRYFDGGAALDWGGGIDIADTDDDAIYRTQRSGSGTGKRRGFSYAIPVDTPGVYLVRLSFAEPYWGAPGGPEGAAGARVFSVSAEDQRLFTDLDIFAEAGASTALVKDAEIEVQDGELNLHFVASAGEPIVAAIEIMEPGS